MVRKDFDEQCVGQTPIHDDRALGALPYGIETGFDLGDHAAVNDALVHHVASTIGAEFRNQFSIAVEHTGNVGQHHQPARTHRRGDGSGRGISIDV